MFPHFVDIAFDDHQDGLEVLFVIFIISLSCAAEKSVLTCHDML